MGPTKAECPGGTWQPESPGGPAGSLEQLGGGQIHRGPDPHVGFKPISPLRTVGAAVDSAVETAAFRVFTVTHSGPVVTTASTRVRACVRVRVCASPLPCFAGVLTWLRAGTGAGTESQGLELLVQQDS